MKREIIRAENFTFSVSPVFLISLYVTFVLSYVLTYWSACFFQYSECKAYRTQSLSNFLYTDPRYAAPAAIFGVLACVCQRSIQIAFEMAVRTGLKKIAMYSTNFDSYALYVTLETFGWISVIGTISYLSVSSVSSSLNVVYDTFHSGAVILTYFARTVWSVCAYIALHDIFNNMSLFFIWTTLSFMLSATGATFNVLRFCGVELFRTFPGNLYFAYIETAIILADLITTCYVYQVVRYKLNNSRV